MVIQVIAENNNLNTVSVKSFQVMGGQDLLILGKTSITGSPTEISYFIHR